MKWTCLCLSRRKEISICLSNALLCVAQGLACLKRNSATTATETSSGLYCMHLNKRFKQSVSSDVPRPSTTVTFITTWHRRTDAWVLTKGGNAFSSTEQGEASLCCCCISREEIEMHSIVWLFLRLRKWKRIVTTHWRKVLRRTLKVFPWPDAQVHVWREKYRWCTWGLNDTNPLSSGWKRRSLSDAVCSERIAVRLRSLRVDLTGLSHACPYRVVAGHAATFAVNDALVTRQW